MSEGTPLHGDRGAWDVINFDTEHARDIMDAALRRHLPLPGLAAGYPRSDGADWLRVQGIPVADLQAWAEGFIIVGGAAEWEAAAFNWDKLAGGIGADMTHGHTNNAQGGTISHDSALSNVSADDHHNEIHAVTSTGPHAEAGLTVGHVLRATGVDTFAFAALAAGDLPTAIGAANIADGSVSNAEFQYLDGMDQSVATGDSPTFAGLTIDTAGNILPADAFGQDLGDATHWWSLYTRDIHYCGATGENWTSFPDNLNEALKWRQASGMNYLTFVSANSQRMVIINPDNVDIDFIVGAIGVGTGLQVRGSDGQITLGGLGAGAVQSSAAGVISSGPLPLTDLASYTQGDLIYGGAADWQDLAHPGVANRVLQSTAAEVGWSANAVTFPTAGAVPIGSGAANRVAYWSAANTLTSDAGLMIDAANDMYIVADGGGIGIGAALERIEFYTAGYVSVMGANFGINTAPKNRLHVQGNTALNMINFDVAIGSVMGSNIYYSGGWKRVTAGYAVLVNYNDGGHVGDISFYQLATGIADSALAFGNPTLYLKNSGRRVGIETTAPLGKLHIDQASPTAAIPVLYLDQADVSEEIIQIVSTAGVGNAIELVGGKTLTVTEFVKVTINGNTRYLQAGTIA